MPPEMQMTVMFYASLIVWGLLCLELYWEAVSSIVPLLSGANLGIGLPTVSDLYCVLPRYACSLAGLFFIDVAAVGLGRFLILWIWPRRFKRGVAIELAVGILAVLPFLVLGLGLGGLLLRVVLTAVFVIAVMVWLRSSGLKAIWPGYRAELWLAAVLLAPSLVCALAPEVEYDSLRYHLALPAQFLARHRIYLADPWPFPNFPLCGEMLYSVGLAFGNSDPVTGGAIAKLLNWQMFPLAIMLIVRTAAAIEMAPVCRTAAWILIASSYMFSLLAGNTYTDMVAVTAFAAAINVAVTSGCKSAGLLFGICLGAAGGAKLNAIVLAPAIMLTMMPARVLSVAVIGWAAMLAPWAVKNTLLAGSPFGGILFGKFWPALYQSEETLNQVLASRWVPLWDPSQWLWFPRYMLKDAVRAGHELSPFIVIMLPFLIPATRMATPSDLTANRGSIGRWSMHRLRLGALLSIVVWSVLGCGQVRMLAPAVPVILLACLGVLSSATIIRRKAVLAYGIILGLSGMLGFARTVAVINDRVRPLNVAIGMEQPREYLARILMPRYLYMPIGAWLDEHPEAGRPYLAGDIKAYYWPRSPLFDSELYTPYLVRWTRESHDERRLAIKFRQHGIGCLVHWAEGSLTFQQIVGGYRWDTRSLGVLQRFVGMYLKSIRRMDRGKPGDHYRIYLVSRGRMKVSTATVDPHLEMPYAELLIQEADRAVEEGRHQDARRELERILIRYHGYAVPHLRLAALAEIDGDTGGAAWHKAVAVRLMSE